MAQKTIQATLPYTKEELAFISPLMEQAISVYQTFGKAHRQAVGDYVSWMNSPEPVYGEGVNRAGKRVWDYTDRAKRRSEYHAAVWRNREANAAKEAEALRQKMEEALNPEIAKAVSSLKGEHPSYLNKVKLDLSAIGKLGALLGLTFVGERREWSIDLTEPDRLKLRYQLMEPVEERRYLGLSKRTVMKPVTKTHEVSF